MCDGASIGISDLRLPAAGSISVTSAGGSNPGKLTMLPAIGEPLHDALEHIERASIEKALIANRYNKTKAAAQLGITFRALRYKLKKLGME
jgi:two-component system response regulator PilR (NtrC family)